MSRNPGSETGLSTVDQYYDMVRRDLRDLFGAQTDLEPVTAPVTRDYGRPDPREAWIQLPGRTHVVRFRRRSLVISDDETRLLRAYVAALHAFARVPSVFATTASEDVLTRSIAVRCTSTDEQAKTLETVMQAVVRYATKTYEGMRVAVSLCLDFGDLADGEPLVSFLEQSWAPVLGSGLTSAVQLAANGSAQRVIDLPAAATDDLLAPTTSPLLPNGPRRKVA